MELCQPEAGIAGILLAGQSLFSFLSVGSLTVAMSFPIIVCHLGCKSRHYFCAWRVLLSLSMVLPRGNATLLACSILVGYVAKSFRLACAGECVDDSNLFFHILT